MYLLGYELDCSMRSPQIYKWLQPIERGSLAARDTSAQILEFSGAYVGARQR